VGSTLRKALEEQGHKVRLLVRRGSPRKPALADKLEMVNGDILDTNSCLRACDGCEAVVHLVGIIREFPARGITFDELHVTATGNIVEAAKRQGIKRFIHMSALGSKEGATSRYHRTKFEAEKIVENSGIAWTIFRPSVIFAPGDEFTRMIVDIAGRAIVPLVSGGKALMQPVALSDVCRCMAFSLGIPETRGTVFELGGADRVSFREIIERVSAHLGKKPKLIYVPAAFVKPVVGFMQRFPSFPLTYDQLVMLLEDNTCDTTQAEKIFGFKPESYLKNLGVLVQSAFEERLEAA